MKTLQEATRTEKKETEKQQVILAREKWCLGRVVPSPPSLFPTLSRYWRCPHDYCRSCLNCLDGGISYGGVKFCSNMQRKTRNTEEHNTKKVTELTNALD